LHHALNIYMYAVFVCTVYILQGALLGVILDDGKAGKSPWLFKAPLPVRETLLASRLRKLEPAIKAIARERAVMDRHVSATSHTGASLGATSTALPVTVRSTEAAAAAAAASFADFTDDSSSKEASVRRGATTAQNSSLTLAMLTLTAAVSASTSSAAKHSSATAVLGCGTFGRTLPPATAAALEQVRQGCAGATSATAASAAAATAAWDSMPAPSAESIEMELLAEVWDADLANRKGVVGLLKHANAVPSITTATASAAAGTAAAATGSGEGASAGNTVQVDAAELAAGADEAAQEVCTH
jgi:hypothetical protein